jgi:hypothetical protein
MVTTLNIFCVFEIDYDLPNHLLILLWQISLKFLRKAVRYNTVQETLILKSDHLHSNLWNTIYYHKNLNKLVKLSVL